MGGTTRAPKSLTPPRVASWHDDEEDEDGGTWYHGTPDERSWDKGGPYGFHVGTYEAARQALEATIGAPAEGDWDGTREYGKTPIVSNKKNMGYDTGLSYRGKGQPRHEHARYSDGTPVPLDARPGIFPVRITGPMANHPGDPVDDEEANNKVKGGRGRYGYYYSNVGEEAGSISAALPSAGHVERIHRPKTAAAWSPQVGIFGPTTGLDPRLFDEDGSLRPQVRHDVMTRLDQCIRVNSGLAGSDWQDWTRVYIAGGSASEWAGSRPSEQAQDLDVIVAIDLAEAQGCSAFEGMNGGEAASALNRAFHRWFNIDNWQPEFGGRWNLTAFCNQRAQDGIGAIRPYAAYDLTEARWAVKPPHLPQHSVKDFDPAVTAHARAVLAEARAVLRMPEPLRTREARDLWEHVHAHRCTAFSGEGTGWDDPGNVDEKMLAYAPGGVLAKIKELAYAEPQRKTAAAQGYLRNPYHGTPEFGGRDEWSHTWFHGTKGEPDFGTRRKDSDEARRAALPPEQREMNFGWTQPNQHLGVHFSPLHEVAHKFAGGGIASVPSAVVHARLKGGSPAHFESEDHLNIAMADWASRHYPHWHDEKLNGTMGWNYSDQEGTHRDFSQVPEDHRERWRLAQKAQSLLQWHPHMPEILQGFKAHLRSQGHHGITYGNNLEGPYLTDGSRGGDAAVKYEQKNKGMYGKPRSISAIADPDDIEVTHAEHIAPWQAEPEAHQRTWEDVSDQDEPDEMRDRVLGWHREHGGRLPFKLAYAPGGVLGRIRELALAPKTAAAGPRGWWKLYHGTNREFAPGDRVENGRRRAGSAYTGDQVFASDELQQAKEYAHAASRESGGHPRVYEVEPVGTASPAREQNAWASGDPMRVKGLAWEHGEGACGQWGCHVVSGAAQKTASWDSSGSDNHGVYLRFGGWPHDERSYSPAGGYHEEGVSAYDLDREGDPQIGWEGEHGNDPEDEMRGRVHRAESARANDRDDPHDAGHLVRGEKIGTGYDGEPLLKNVRRVGDWIDHRHLFLDQAGPHRLARDPSDEGYEEPEEKPPYGYRNRTAAVTQQNHPCRYCGEPLDDEDVRDGHSAHEECSGMRWCEPHQDYHDDPAEAEGHNDTYTDWGSYLPFEGGMHRGLTVRLPQDLHDRVHDESRSPAGRAAALKSHLDEGGGYGVHWTDHLPIAQAWGSGEGAMFSGVDPKDPAHTHVVIHAASPAEEHIEDDPEKLAERNMWGFGHQHSEREIPLREGAPVRVTGISWKRGGKDQWNRHDFGEVTRHTASWDDEDEAGYDEDPDRYVTCGQGHSHWGALGAAGLLIRHREGDSGPYRYLLQKRSPYVQHGSTWSTPGGALQHGEAPEEGALREAGEEGMHLPSDLVHRHTFTDDHGNWAYHTAVFDSPRQFDPAGHGESDWESEGHGWFTPAEVRKLPLHPGFAASWDKVRKSAAVQRAAWDGSPLYHGSLDRFEPGTVLTPEGKSPDGSRWSGDYVYASTNPDAARYFGSMHDTSPQSNMDVHVHRVEPVGAVEPDEFPEGAEDERYAHGNYRAPALRVIDSRRVPGHWAGKTAAVEKTAAWDDYDGEVRPWHEVRPGESGEDIAARRERYVSQVAGRHGVSREAAHKALAQVHRDLHDDVAFGDTRAYGFANSPGHQGDTFFTSKTIHHLNQPGTWEGREVEQVPTAEIHASQNWVRPRTVAHNLFHPGTREPASEDELGQPSLDPRDNEDPSAWEGDDIASLAGTTRFVRRADGRVQVADGHHRVAADLILGKKTTPGVVIDESHLRAAAAPGNRPAPADAAGMRRHLIDDHEMTRSGLPDGGGYQDLADEHEHHHEFEQPYLDHHHEAPGNGGATQKTAAYNPDDRIVRRTAELGWDDDEWAAARREPWHAAAKLAQRQARHDHPKLAMDFPRGEEGDRMTGHLLRHVGYQGDVSGAFAARHPNPAAMTSNPAWLNGHPGVALHPDRWDYGTVAHEAAHHAVMEAHGVGPNQYESDEASHGPEWAGHYAAGLNRISKNAGDEFLGHHQFYRDMIAEGLQWKRPRDLDAADERWRGSGESYPRGPLTREGSAGYTPPQMPPRQQEAHGTGDHADYRRKLLDVARNPEPGTVVWRSEMRPKGEGPHPESVGMHWTVNPNQVVHTWDTATHHTVVYQGRLHDPASQAIPRSHPMWSGRHMSMDSEAEVRLHPGSHVHVEGTWTPGVPFGRDQNEDGTWDERDMPAPLRPDRMPPGHWKWNPVGADVPVRHGGTGIDYSDAGISREASAPSGTSQRPKRTPGSAMVYLDVPHGTVEPHEGQEAGHHVALAYLPRKIGDGDFARVVDRAREAAARHAPMKAVIGGGMTFPPGTPPDQRRASVVPVHAPGIHELHAEFAEFDRAHYEAYTPHVTRAQLGGHQADPPPHPEASFPVTHVHVRRGDEVHSFPLTGPSRREAAADDYRQPHQGPDADDGEALHELGTKGFFPPDVHDHPEGYGADHNTARQMRNARGNPEARVAMYRAMPSPHHKINPGDWVTLSKDYALKHAEESDPDNSYAVLGKQVRAKHLRNDGNDLQEWTYHGPVQHFPRLVDRGGRNGGWKNSKALSDAQWKDAPPPGEMPPHEAVSGYDGLTGRSGMIYLDLPPGTVRPVPGGVDDHHVTLVYLGKDVSDEAFAEACRRTREAAARLAPMDGVLRGIDVFPPSKGSDGKVVAFVPAYVGGVGALRRELEDLSASEHKDWRSHITLAYLEEGDSLPAPHPAVPLRFTRVHVKRGDDVVSFPLGGMRREGAKDPLTYYHGHGRDSRALTGIDDWDNAGLFVSHDPEVARLYGPSVDRVEMAPDTRVKSFSGQPGKAVENMRKARDDGYDVVEFHKPHDFIGHVILNQGKIVRREPFGGAQGPSRVIGSR